MCCHKVGIVISSALMRIVGMMPPLGGGGTTTSSIDVAESTKKRLNNSRPEADPSMRNSNYSSGMASKFIAHQHTTWRHHRP
jgi:hypothetical protein